jgi:hypothetical protein
MSISIDQFANITIVADGSPLKKAAFGTLAILVGESAAAVAVSTYTKASDVATDFGTDSEAYRCALRAFSQQPRPKRIKVIEANVGLTHLQTFTVQAATDGTVTSITLLKADGTSASYTHTAASDTTSTIATELAASIDADGDVAAAAVGAVITITGSVVGEFNRPTATTNLGTYAETSADPGYATVLNTAITTDNDWYGLVTDSGSSAVVTAVAASTTGPRTPTSARMRHGSRSCSPTPRVARTGAARRFEASPQTRSPRRRSGSSRATTSTTTTPSRIAT